MLRPPGAQAAVVAGTFGVRLVPFPFTAIDRVVPLTDDQVRALAYSVDGQVLAAAAGESVRVWDTLSGRLLDWLSVGRTVTTISLAPAGSMLAVALGTDIIVIDRGTGTPLTRAYHDGESRSST